MFLLRYFLIKGKKKLGEKVFKCTFIGDSENFKAYKLINPIKDLEIINMDIVFDENEKWQ